MKDKKYSLEDLFKNIENYDKNKYKASMKGKISATSLPKLKTRDIVKVVKARPKQKNRRKNQYSGKYLQVLFNEKGILTLIPANEFEVESDKNQRNQIRKLGYTTYDLYDLDYFVQNNFPQMIDDHIEKLNKYVDLEKMPDKNKAIRALINLKEFLEEQKELDTLALSYDSEEYKEFEKKSKKVWGDFGKYIHYYWI